MHMVPDKILSGLSSAYAPIVTHPQLESPQRDVPSMINAVNAWERADLQRAESVIKAARANQDIYDTNQGGEFPAAHLARGHSRRMDSSHSHSSTGKEFDWTKTKNRTDVCYRCGLPSHFAQYCVSSMPDDVQRRIIRNRERQAQLAKDGSSDSEHDTADVAATAFTANSHIAAAAVDLPSEVNIDTMDPTIRESMFAAYTVPYPPPSFFADQSPTPPSPTLTASTLSIAGTLKKKKPKKKKKCTLMNEIQAALEGMSLKEAEENKYSM
ncbi:hypothetical protein MVEN_00085200 [Mycena venus]|uniref:CCHC-type domain-containing protein n=1 Tax=Mycena venus TaxID=2733690 RepID=A0A8H6Z7F1_9AGAR|nr:hypothetical protein MVEN_00085200 [Mycena venus]